MFNYCRQETRLHIGIDTGCVPSVIRKLVLSLAALSFFPGSLTAVDAASQVFYVAPTGRDIWSGRLSAANADLTDGPFASITRARDAIRTLQSEAPLSGPVSVQLRGGLYYLEQPITFRPEDSGTVRAPITYMAYPGETPELIGGIPLSKYKTTAGPNGPLSFDLPDSGRPWGFRSLFVDGRREPRARYPNQDPADPIRKGFLYASAGPDWLAFGVHVGGIHHAGDWLEYRLTIPVSGDYTLWIHYGAFNLPSGLVSMSGRCSVRQDGGRSLSLADLADTGDWKPVRWARTGTLRLTAGEHTLRWQNVKGGGLNLDALALCDDPAWKPAGTHLELPRQGHLVGVSAMNFTRSHGLQITVGNAGTGVKDSIWCGPGDFRQAWLSAPDAEVHIFQSGDCRAYSEILSIRGYDPHERRLLLSGPEAGSFLNPGDRYFVENVPEELDAPGEWYLDPRAGTLAYQPRAGFSEKSEVIVPRMTCILQVGESSLAGLPVRSLCFVGLTFRDTDWHLGGASAGYGMGKDGALRFQNAEQCEVKDCRFSNLGSYGVCLDRGRGNLVQSCDMAHVGGGGVLVLESSDNLIADNHIHHLGEAYQHVGGIVLVGAGASGNTISHNAIHDSPRYGISLKNPGPHNVIEFNRIQNTSLETSDSGGIEVTQEDRAFRSGSVIRNNFVADTIGFSSIFGTPTYMSWGIYLDSFASGYEVSGNLVCRTWNGGFMLQGGRENRIVNNIFVDGQVSQGNLANFERHSAALQIKFNVFAFSSREAPVFETGVFGPEVVQIDRNLYFPPMGSQPTFGPGGALTFDAWRRQGWDASSLVADPRFHQPARDDYRLLPGSPAFRLGFRPLSLDQVGPRTCGCSCQVQPAGRLFWRESLVGVPTSGKERRAKNTQD